jgi:hypothetical protein
MRRRFEWKWTKFQWFAVTFSVLLFIVDCYYVSAGQQHHHVFSSPPGRILLGYFLLGGSTIAMALDAESDWRARRLCQALIVIHAVAASTFLYYAQRF